jgi:PAS domain S-box-containing protein
MTTANRPLRVIYLEDSPADRELVKGLLKEEKLASEFIMVDRRDQFVEAVEAGNFDLILSDYSLPSFDGLSALKIAQDTCPQIPFILLSGVMGEERAVESLKQGATDYVLKQRIERLVPSVRRAVREVEERARREAAEDQLRLSEERLRQITDNVSDLIVQLDNNGDWQYCRPSLRTLLNEPAATPGVCFAELVHEQDRDSFAQALKETIRTGTGRTIEFRLQLADQSLRSLESQINVVCNERGAVTSVILVSRDITDRSHAEEQIRAQAALLDKAQDAITVCDMNDGVVYWNKGAEHLYGWSSEETLGKNLHELLHGTEIPDQVTEAREVVRHKGEWKGEHRHRTRDGKEILIQSRWTLVKDQDGKPKSQLIINTDVTDKKISESHFLRSQRLESLGALSSGIAHELNNMLAPIILASQLLRLRVDDSEGLRWLDTMESTTQRGANLIKQVLPFARGDEGDRIETSASHLIGEISTILKQKLNRSIQIQTTVADDLWPVIGDPTQLHQVLMNLCVNARDAMPEGGRIHVSAENILLKENDPLLRNGGHPGLHVQITVADTGMGMPADVQKRIFDPFYTTKEHGQGSGLGLTTVQTILANHEGFAVVESEQGRGSRFKIFIPAVTTAPITSPAKSSRPTLPRGNGETILLVDDEAAFREITQATLEKYGYNVLTANDGTEGLTEFMRHRAEISVVITDIMMPVMDGAALIRSLRKMETSVRFIAISGLLEAEKATVNEAAPDANVEFLAKPFSTESLLLIVHKVPSRES